MERVATNFEVYMNQWGVKTFGSKYKQRLGLSDNFSAGFRSMSIGKTTQFLIDPASIQHNQVKQEADVSKLVSPFTVPRRGKVREQIVGRYSHLKRLQPESQSETDEDMQPADEMHEFLNQHDSVGGGISRIGTNFLGIQTYTPNEEELKLKAAKVSKLIL